MRGGVATELRRVAAAELAQPKLVGKELSRLTLTLTLTLTTSPHHPHPHPTLPLPLPLPPTPNQELSCL